MPLRLCVYLCALAVCVRAGHDGRKRCALVEPAPKGHLCEDLTFDGHARCGAPAR